MTGERDQLLEESTRNSQKINSCTALKEDQF